MLPKVLSLSLHTQIVTGMATIALALLKFNQDPLPPEEQLRSELNQMKKAICVNRNDRVIQCFRQIEDPTELYVVCSSGSTTPGESDERLPSEIKTILESSCKDLCNIVWILHVDVECSKLPTEAHVMAIGRHFVRPGCAAQFDATYSDVKNLAENFPANRGLTEGWRINADATHCEWVQFSGWDEVAAHRTFPKSEAFQEYAKIRQYVDEVEVRHCVSLGLC